MLMHDVIHTKETAGNKFKSRSSIKCNNIARLSKYGDLVKKGIMEKASENFERE